MAALSMTGNQGPVAAGGGAELGRLGRPLAGDLGIGLAAVDLRVGIVARQAQHERLAAGPGQAVGRVGLQAAGVDGRDVFALDIEAAGRHHLAEREARRAGAEGDIGHRRRRAG